MNSIKLFFVLSLYLSLSNCTSHKVGFIPNGQNPDTFARFYELKEELEDFSIIYKVVKNMCNTNGFPDASGYRLDDMGKYESNQFYFFGSGVKYRNLLVWCKR
jgi:hypothetical protein